MYLKTDSFGLTKPLFLIMLCLIKEDKGKY